MIEIVLLYATLIYAGYWEAAFVICVGCNIVQLMVNYFTKEHRS